MLSQIRSYMASWWHHTPLPPPSTAAPPHFQKWHEFEQQRWMPVVSGKTTSRPGTTTTTKHQWTGSFRLVSWNTNASTSFPESRICALLQAVKTMGNADVVFLQEVCREALAALLEETWIQQQWYTSDVDGTAFRTQKFISVTLVSRRWVATAGILLGAIWRVALPSRFARDALCCDVVFNSASENVCPGRELRIRLVNVHLDSLPINPSLRPRQLSFAASYLRAAGRGVIAGDFNPVLAEDEDLVRANGLVDAWVQCHPREPGYTWGVDGEQSFPPNRLDKVALLNLSPSAMGILPTREVGVYAGETAVGGTESASKEHFSDHFGLWCDVAWAEDGAQQE
ncbi:hypothetical protein ACJQWK_05238 [Exserohilum turcicum]